jgi:HEAT repeat protein
VVTLLAVPARAGVSVEAAKKGAAEKAARDAVARFDKGDPGWRVRMGALVELAKQGPATAPVLVEALKTGSPSAREFAAQALVLFAEPSTRPALEQALDDPKSGVRIHAVQALSMLGRLEATERHERLLKNDPSAFGVRAMMAAALTREDRPDPARLRKALANYDLRNLDSARVGEMAPDFTLTDFQGKTHRLSQFRGKKTMVLRFILFDF